MRGRDTSRWVLAGVAVLAGLGMWRMAAVEAEMAAAQLADPTAVAVIDIGRVLDALDEKAVRLADLQAHGEKLRQGVEDIQAELEAAKSDLEVLPRDTPQYLDQQDKAIRLEMKFQGEQEFAKFRFNERLQRAKLELFNKIVSAAGIYAQREGFDIVINDDRDLQIPPEQVGQMNDQTFQAFVTSRRMIYADDAVDITDEVAQMMNINFKAK